MTRIFLDTNVLVYADQPTSIFHHAARAAILSFEAAGDELWISPRIIREYLAVMTRANPSLPDQAPLTPAVAAKAAERLLTTFWIADEGPDVSVRLLSLVAARGISGRLAHDANIVATMLAHDIMRLATFNARDFPGFTDLIEVTVPGQA
jgi:predicted nucleic acid-binding protein